MSNLISIIIIFLAVFFGLVIFREHQHMFISNQLKQIDTLYEKIKGQNLISKTDHETLINLIYQTISYLSHYPFLDQNNVIEHNLYEKLDYLEERIKQING